MPQVSLSRGKSMGEKISEKIYWLLRIAVVVNVVLLFFPSFNPARVSSLINKNLSLFSCGVSYDNIVANFGRAFRMGWVKEADFHSLNYCSFFLIVAVVVLCAGGCMSLGNIRMKKVGLCISAAGGIMEIISFGWMR